MAYDIIFVTGEAYFDHPFSGTAILRRLLEKAGYRVGIIEMPRSSAEIQAKGAPRLFFGATSGSIDSMVRNYTPLKKRREDDTNLTYHESVPDRATTVYSNWIREHYPGIPIVIGGTEASLRRFTHYDYWQNRLRKPILCDSRADILAYGPAEKQILEIARRIAGKKELDGIPGTCIIRREVPEGFTRLPSSVEAEDPKRFCEMQMMLSNEQDQSQQVGTRHILQYRYPEITPADLDSTYSLPFTRQIPKEHAHLRGFEFSIVTHRGCIGRCNFCAIGLMQGTRIISRTERSILDEIRQVSRLPTFRGNIDDLGGPSANMYGMDCRACDSTCLDCATLDRSNSRLISLLRKARALPGIRKVNIRSGIRYDLASPDYLKELATHHIADTLKIAPEHTDKSVLTLMNKDRGDLQDFIKLFSQFAPQKKLSFYFMTGHPGCGIRESRTLAKDIKNLDHAENIQIFTPTPMTISTCMYLTGIDPRTGKKVHVPHSYREKKDQKRIAMGLPG